MSNFASDAVAAWSVMAGAFMRSAQSFEDYETYKDVIRAAETLYQNVLSPEERELFDRHNTMFNPGNMSDDDAAEVMNDHFLYWPDKTSPDNAGGV